MDKALARAGCRAPAEPLLKARGLLRGAGLRATNSRLLVLRGLFNEERPLSHLELARKLAAEGLNRVTVFRNLNDLAEANVLSRVDLGDHTWRFEFHRPGRSRRAGHSHFVCDRCSRVSCLRGVNVRISRRKRDEIIGSVSAVVLRGRCRRC